jgi:cation diffusion facilitator family transporter
MRTAKKRHSPALAAEAFHYRLDAITSLFAAIALGWGALFPRHIAIFDHAGAMFIAILMVILGIYASRKNLHQLMDKTPDQKFFDLARKAALKVDGVRETEKIKIQLYGPDAHIDIDIEVDPNLSVKIAHEMTQKVRAEIQKAWPAVRDVTVHVEPYYPNDH